MSEILSHEPPVRLILPSPILLRIMFGVSSGPVANGVRLKGINYILFDDDNVMKFLKLLNMKVYIEFPRSMQVHTFNVDKWYTTSN